MWIYRQLTGELSYTVVMGFGPHPVPVGTGYAGAGASRNNPLDQAKPNCGPLPRGLYTIGAAYTDSKLGTYAMRLTPDTQNKMYGRGEFLIHADSIEHPGQASEGCIVLGQAARIAVAIHPDRQLEVC